MHCVRQVRSVVSGVSAVAKPCCRRSIVTTNFPYTTSGSATWKLHEKNEYPKSDITWEEAIVQKKVRLKEERVARRKMTRKERTSMTVKKIAVETGSYKDENELPELPPVDQARLEPRYTAGAIALVLSHAENIRLLGHKLLPLIPDLPPPATRSDYIRRAREERRFKPNGPPSDSTDRFPQVDASNHSFEDIYADPMFQEHLMEAREGRIWQPLTRPTSKPSLGIHSAPQASYTNPKSTPSKPPDTNLPLKRKPRLYASAPVINPR